MMNDQQKALVILDQAANKLKLDCDRKIMESKSWLSWLGVKVIPVECELPIRYMTVNDAKDRKKGFYKYVDDNGITYQFDEFHGIETAEERSEKFKQTYIGSSDKLGDIPIKENIKYYVNEGGLGFFFFEEPYRKISKKEYDDKKFVGHHYKEIEFINDNNEVVVGSKTIYLNTPITVKMKV